MGKFQKISGTSTSSEVALQRLTQLEQLLLQRMPLSVHMLILCRIALKQRYPEGTAVEFYRYVDGNEDDTNWHNDLQKDSFIVCIEKPNIHSQKGIILLPPEKQATADMISSFDTFIGWDTPHLFHSVPNPFSDVIQQLCISHNNLKKIDNDGLPGIVMSMLDIEKAKSLEISHDDISMQVRPLELEDVPEVVANWKWAIEHSEKEIEKSVQHLGGMGVFTEKGEMASSVLLSPLGALGVLYTPDKFRRKGLGQLVIRAISKKISRELGIHPFGEAEVRNTASKALFEKVGFEEVYRTKWFYFTPS